ncbi:uncharacterized protein [Physcomitrium patens]|uniref:Uncharacterized protein n=1 Tax=Physcomitrium patens TaxID=3218 RepID=A0A2K1IZJ7_PHYPA|nr:uncharacterized protein LOC112295004 [Physcomitrium patens]XP_024401851.1 uncharacterized protein LOC112295004 [Physcomitrium patens]XP_024401852.1 uncharacterized protein LOC112295004 [Physcomitrium patens]XP_024401853.1 uncharacterized protein LOC112295004 [Physcomitrium patens]PNR34703.1 hypothetical protein PHYPA_022601 [Physcomitrium patens]|eukprot:XP_024401850.1 uncharacterized protein LOC112295004 [Physcomitrella patens]
MAVTAAMAARLTVSIPLSSLSSTPRQGLHTLPAASRIAFWRSGLIENVGSASRFTLLHSTATWVRHPKPNRFLRAAQSSTDNKNAKDDNLEITKQRLQELSASLVLPANYFERLPSDLRVDCKDAAFALSNGALNDECGEQAGDLLMQLSRTWERCDTSAAAAVAKQLPTLLDKLPNQSSSQSVGRRFVRAGRFFTATGQYENGELLKIGKALTAAGEAFSVGDLPVTETPVATTKAFKFGDLQLEITAQKAYFGAAVSVVFGLLSWQLTSGLQNQSDNSLQFANDNAFLLATSLRGALLAAGYFCAVLSALTMVGLLVLASTIGKEEK